MWLKLEVEKATRGHWRQACKHFKRQVGPLLGGPAPLQGVRIADYPAA